MRNFEEAVRKAAREKWGDRVVRRKGGSSWESDRPKWHIDGDIEFREDGDFWDEYDMKDVTPRHEPPPTPKPRSRTVQLHENNLAGKGCYEIMMPNGLYLAGADGMPYLLRFKGGYDTASRRETTVEKFTKVYENFRRFWP
jgi:hypothetical protein